MEFIGLLWNEGILRPMINSLVFLYSLLFDNFGASILIFTAMVRVVTLPLTLKQIHQTRGMSKLQPQIKELQQKYANDRQRISKETMRLYKEQGINPLGCLGPLFIQMPIWIGLYQSIIRTLPANPESLAGLSQKLYSWLPMVNEAVPLGSQFLWLDLALPDRTPALPILVGASMWAVQKMSMPASADPRQAQTSQMMLWMMPLMMAFFSFSLPSGLSLYWVASNLIQIVIQYFITGWGPLLRSSRAEPVPQTASTQPVKEIAQHGELGSDGEISRRGPRERPRPTRRRSRGGKGRRH